MKMGTLLGVLAAAAAVAAIAIAAPPRTSGLTLESDSYAELATRT